MNAQDELDTIIETLEIVDTHSETARAEATESTVEALREMVRKAKVEAFQEVWQAVQSMPRVTQDSMNSRMEYLLKKYKEQF